MEKHKIDIAGHVTVIETPVGFGELLTAAMCDQKRYPETVPNPENEGEEIPNPQSKQEFTALEILAFCRAIVAGYRRKLKTAAALTEAATENASDREAIIIREPTAEEL